MRNKNNTTSGRTAREGRQQRALARQEARNVRTPEQQITLLAKRPGASAKEIARLTPEGGAKVSRQKRAKRKAAA